MARRRGLLLLQDACQAHGAQAGGRPLTRYSPAVAYSFYPTKNLPCLGDGGAVLTNHEDVDRRIRKLRNHGSDQRSRHSMGYNSRLDDLQAGVLSAKLPREPHPRGEFAAG